MSEKKLLQDLECLMRIIMDLKVKIDLFHKEFKKPLKTDYDALKEVLEMKNIIDSLINPRNSIEAKVRAKCDDKEDEAIFKLLINEDEGSPSEIEQNDEEELGIGDDEEIDIKLDFGIEETNSDPDYDPLETIDDTTKDEKLPKKRKITPRIAKTQEKETSVLKESSKKKIRISRNLPSLPCSICNKLMKPYFLKKHEERHSLPTESLECQVCQKVYKTRTNLNLHIKKIHENIPKTCVCEYCGKAFWRKFHLEKHMMMHKDDTPYSCKECGAAYKYKESLNAHMEFKHSSHGVLCSTCGIEFATQDTLKKHILIIHEKPENPRPHVCTICKRAFKEKAHLKYHLNTHTNPNSKKRGLNKESPAGGMTLAGNPRKVRTKWHKNTAVK